MSLSNKDLSKKTQTVLKELGYDVSLGHAYELLSKLAGFASWNVAKASGANLSGKSSGAERDEFFDKARRQADLGPVDATPYLCTLTASATVRLSQTLYAKTEDEAKRTFLDNVANNRVSDVEVVESPAPNHDYKPDDVEIEVDTDHNSDPTRLIRTLSGIRQRVPGASAHIGKGENIYEAKIVTQAAEAKIYVEIRANSDDEAKTVLSKWMDKTDLTSPPMMQVSMPEDRVPELGDWEVIWLDSVEVQHIRKV